MMDRRESKRRAAELLPFYVNGTLSPGERAEVEALLREDEDLRRECDVLGHVRAAVRSDTPAQSSGDLGLARLMRAIEAEPVPSGRAGIRLAALAASLVAAIALGMVVGRSGADRDTVYQQAGYQQAGAAAADRILVVAFRPSASQGEVSGLLLDHEVVIVDGPSAIGLYRLAVPEAQTIEDTLAALRAASALVESADVAE